MNIKSLNPNAMVRIFKNTFSVVYTLFKFSLYKIFHFKSFHFYLIERFSPNTSISFIGGGTIILGKKVRAHSLSKFRVCKNGKLILRDNTKFNFGCIIVAHNLVEVKEGCEFGPNVTIYDHDHDFRSKNGIKDNKFTSGPVIIGKNCWIGASTIILKGTEIGDNCVIGAGSIIKGKYPDNSIIYQQRTTSILPID